MQHMDAQGQPGEGRRTGRRRVRCVLCGRPALGLDPQGGAFGEMREVGRSARAGDDGARKQGAGRAVLVRGQGAADGLRGRGIDPSAASTATTVSPVIWTLRPGEGS
ncbi:hypothetical protein O1L68_27905 [Streptomyces lydicus]|nr:hypothetical protein [Streptomyces lydicus]